MSFRTLFAGGAVVVAIAAPARPLDAKSQDTQEPPTAAFDWSMPQRTGLDADHDGIIDSFTTVEQIDPDTFTVDFDACASVNAIHYRWTINGEFIGQVEVCKFSHQLAQSVYTVTLETEDANGSTASITKPVPVRDWLIVAVGDSYGSGEGNPEKDGVWADPLNPVVWQDNRCHRSHFSGQAKAAQRIEDDDPRTSVTFVHLSCTGAVMEGVWEDQLSQLHTVIEHKDLPNEILPGIIGDREIDALLMSIGGNDAGFSDIIKNCILTEPCDQPDLAPVDVGTLVTFCGALPPPYLSVACLVYGLFLPQEGAATTFANGIGKAFDGVDNVPPETGKKVEPKTKWLGNGINSFQVLMDDPKRVYWTEYPDLTQNKNGDPCESEFLKLSMLPGISRRETVWMRGTLIGGLNGKILDKSLEAGWTYVGEIFEGFHAHGYCSDFAWVQRIQDSLDKQQDLNGTAHPNGDGHKVYSDAIWAKLDPDLYLGEGADRTPRPLRDLVPPIVTGDPDRSPNADGWYNEDVTIDWSTTDPVPSSGLYSVAGDTIASTEGLKVPYVSDDSCDVAQNCGHGTLKLSIDKTPPHMVVDDSSKVDGDNGWYRKAVEVTFRAADAISGMVSPCQAAPGDPCKFKLTSDAQGSAVTIPSGQVCDEAGNCNPGINAGPFMIDSVKPTLAPTIVPNPVVLNGSATATANATDATSSVASQSCAAVDTTTAGAHTLTCTATDNAGNTETVSVPYVVEYSIVGFGKPAPTSKWRAGTTVPIKVALASANGAVIQDSEAQALLSPTCRVMFSVSGVETASGCMRYDAAAHQFIYNWALGDLTGAVTIAVTISYPGSDETTVLSMPITITR